MKRIWRLSESCLGKNFLINSNVYCMGWGPIIVKYRISWSCMFWHQEMADDIIAFFARKPRTKVGAAEQNNILESIFHKIMHPKWRLPHGGGSHEKTCRTKKLFDGVTFDFLAYPARFPRFSPVLDISVLYMDVKQPHAQWRDVFCDVLTRKSALEHKHVYSLFENGKAVSLNKENTLPPCDVHGIIRRFNYRTRLNLIYLSTQLSLFWQHKYFVWNIG